jgi:hypothetical protein
MHPSSVQKRNLQKPYFGTETQDEDFMPCQEDCLSHCAENGIAVDQVSSEALSWAWSIER